MGHLRERLRSSQGGTQKCKLLSLSIIITDLTVKRTLLENWKTWKCSLTHSSETRIALLTCITYPNLCRTFLNTSHRVNFLPIRTLQARSTWPRQLLPYHKPTLETTSQNFPRLEKSRILLYQSSKHRIQDLPPSTQFWCHNRPRWWTISAVLRTRERSQRCIMTSKSTSWLNSSINNSSLTKLAATASLLPLLTTWTAARSIVCLLWCWTHSHRRSLITPRSSSAQGIASLNSIHKLMEARLRRKAQTTQCRIAVLSRFKQALILLGFNYLRTSQRLQKPATQPRRCSLSR